LDAGHGGCERGVLLRQAGIGKGDVDGEDGGRSIGQLIEKAGEGAAEGTVAAGFHEGAVVDGGDDGGRGADAGGVESFEPVVDGVIDAGGERGPREKSAEDGDQCGHEPGNGGSEPVRHARGRAVDSGPSVLLYPRWAGQARTALRMNSTPTTKRSPWGLQWRTAT
jgi:hypothetical protein